MSTDAITSGNIATKPAQYTVLGTATCVSSYGHRVTVFIGDQVYQISGFSMTITSKSTTAPTNYNWTWEVSSSKSIYYSDMSTSTVTFSVGVR